MAACGAEGLSSAWALAMRLKYSNARKSSWVTPSPLAYIRPNLHCATGWPPSAAYCSAVSEVSVAGTAFFRAAAAPGCADTTGIGSWFTGAPSKATAGAASGATPKLNAKRIRSNVRIAVFLVRTTWVGYGPIHGRPNLLGILPQRTRRMIGLARSPLGSTFRELRFSQFYVKCAYDGIDLDDVAVLQQADWSAHGCFRAYMADAEAPGGAGEPAVGDHGDL